MKKNFLLLGLLLFSSLSFAQDCPEGFKVEERTVAIFSPNPDVKDSKEAINRHFLSMVASMRKHNIFNAIYLKNKKDPTQIFFYSIVSPEQSKKIIDSDPIIQKKQISYKLENWIECK